MRCPWCLSICNIAPVLPCTTYCPGAGIDVVSTAFDVTIQVCYGSRHAVRAIIDVAMHAVLYNGCTSVPAINVATCRAPRGVAMAQCCNHQSTSPALQWTPGMRMQCCNQDAIAAIDVASTAIDVRMQLMISPVATAIDVVKTTINVDCMCCGRCHAAQQQRRQRSRRRHHAELQRTLRCNAV